MNLFIFHFHIIQLNLLVIMQFCFKENRKFNRKYWLLFYCTLRDLYIQHLSTQYVIYMSHNFIFSGKLFLRIIKKTIVKWTSITFWGRCTLFAVHQRNYFGFLRVTLLANLITFTLHCYVTLGGINVLACNIKWKINFYILKKFFLIHCKL